jgi:lactoylglutathione lyase
MRYLHTAVRVSNLDAALDFYCIKLGMNRVRSISGKHRPCDIIFLAMPGDESAQIELVYYHNEKDRLKYAGFSHIAYEVDDIYLACTNLLEKGMQLSLPPKDGFMAFIQSPDGISFELLQKGKPLLPREPWLSMCSESDW